MGETYHKRYPEVAVEFSATLHTCYYYTALHTLSKEMSYERRDFSPGMETGFGAGKKVFTLISVAYLKVAFLQ